MIKRTFFLSALLFALAAAAFAQEADFSKKIRIALWAELDAYPDSEDAEAAAGSDSSPFAYSISRLKMTAPFLIDGMVYGWNFTYTPYDRLRGVQERFEITAIGSVGGQNGSGIVYSKPWIADNKVNVWIELERTPEMIFTYNMWRGIQSQKARGKGSGKISDGFEGITEAAKDALKNALRAHYRPILKNKPKEIRGRVLIRRAPLLGIDAGCYALDLDFFLETDKITTYTQF
ncbi:MAG: hypothetical protein ACTTKL_01575 [Treponema sp.]